MDEDIETTAGMSRRQLIKRSAVVGGTLMWVAPAVQSFTSPAFGQVGSPACSHNVCIQVTVFGTTFRQCCTLTDAAGFCRCCCVVPGSPACTECANPDPCSEPLAFTGCGPLSTTQTCAELGCG